MALPDSQLLLAINQIADSLSSSERRRIFYLCDRTDEDNSAAHVKEMLQCRAGEGAHLLLMALMLQLKRFDILKRVCHTTSSEVEGALRSTQVLSRFRVLMDNISEDMDSDDLDSVKFLLSKTFSREQRERAKSFLDVIVELEKLDLVSPERVDMLEEYLKNISRFDLAKKVGEYKRTAVTSQQCSAQQQRLMASLRISSPTRSHSPQQMRGGGQPCQNAVTSQQCSAQQQRLMASHQISSPTRSHSPQQMRGGGQPCQNGNIQTSFRREPRYQSRPELYKFNTNPRGVCVIIDCVGNDGDMLQETFTALHFKVVIHKWLSVDGLLSALSGLLTMREITQSDCFVCCIISRGTSDSLLGTDQYSTGLELDRVRYLFAPDECPVLAGKPKLFFIQRYEVPELCPIMSHRAEDLETDGADGPPRYDTIPRDADVFWSHCWTDDHQLEKGYHCSVYLKALVDALHKGQRRKTNLHEVHTEVNAAVFDHNRRNPEAKYHIDLKHTLRKDLYLQ